MSPDEGPRYLGRAEPRYRLIPWWYPCGLQAFWDAAAGQILGTGPVVALMQRGQLSAGLYFYLDSSGRCEGVRLSALLTGRRSSSSVTSALQISQNLLSGFNWGKKASLHVQQHVSRGRRAARN